MKCECCGREISREERVITLTQHGVTTAIAERCLEEMVRAQRAESERNALEYLSRTQPVDPRD